MRPTQNRTYNGILNQNHCDFHFSSLGYVYSMFSHTHLKIVWSEVEAFLLMVVRVKKISLFPMAHMGTVLHNKGKFCSCVAASSVLLVRWRSKWACFHSFWPIKSHHLWKPNQSYSTPPQCWRWLRWRWKGYWHSFHIFRCRQNSWSFTVCWDNVEYNVESTAAVWPLE